MDSEKDYLLKENKRWLSRTDMYLPISTSFPGYACSFLQTGPLFFPKTYNPKKNASIDLQFFYFLSPHYRYLGLESNGKDASLLATDDFLFYNNNLFR